MAKLTPELLSQCLAELESGTMTIDECLSAHPAVAFELRALLEVAAAITPVPAVSLDPIFRSRGRAALIAAINAEKLAVTRPPLQRFLSEMLSGFTRPLVVARRMGMPALIIALIAAFTGLTGGAVYASQDSLPGDGLYALKTATESLQLAIATSDQARAQTYLELAERRLLELELASQKNQAEAVGFAAKAFAHNVAQADLHLSRAADSGQDVSALDDRLAASLARQESALVRVQNRVPELAIDAVSNAAQAAKKGLANSVARRAGDKDVTKRDETGVEATSAKPSTDTVSSTAVSEVGQAISDVQRLAGADKDGAKESQGLIAKLDAAQAALLRGQTNVAANNLDAFWNEINAMKRSGRISGQAYDALNSRYNSIVASLGTAPKATVEPNPANRPTIESQDATEPKRQDDGNKPETRGSSKEQPRGR